MLSENGNNYAQAVTNGWLKEGSAGIIMMGGSTFKKSVVYMTFIILKSDGKMAKSEWVYDNNEKAWYFFSQDGRFKRELGLQWDFRWRDYYYLHPSGKMAHG